MPRSIDLRPDIRALGWTKRRDPYRDRRPPTTEQARKWPRVFRLSAGRSYPRSQEGFRFGPGRRFRHNWQFTLRLRDLRELLRCRGAAHWWPRLSQSVVTWHWFTTGHFGLEQFAASNSECYFGSGWAI